MKKVLNLYCGLGGNRSKWGYRYDVTAVEIDPKIAKVYSLLYPKDKVIVGDAHDYLKEHYSEFDIIWTSPPCQTHSSFRKNICCNFRGTKAEYPDMKLYSEILFLKHYFKGDWIVENVKPYYEPLIQPTAKVHRHYIWSNKEIKDKKFETANLRKAQIKDLQEYHNIDLSQFDLKGLDKRQLLRNMINSDMGRYLIKSL